MPRDTDYKALLICPSSFFKPIKTVLFSVVYSIPLLWITVHSREILLLSFLSIPIVSLTLDSEFPPH